MDLCVLAYVRYLIGYCNVHSPERAASVLSVSVCPSALNYSPNSSFGTIMEINALCYSDMCDHGLSYKTCVHRTLKNIHSNQCFTVIFWYKHFLK